MGKFFNRKGNQSNDHDDHIQGRVSLSPDPTRGLSNSDLLTQRRMTASSLPIPASFIGKKSGKSSQKSIKEDKKKQEAVNGSTTENVTGSEISGRRKSSARGSVTSASINLPPMTTFEKLFSWRMVIVILLHFSFVVAIFLRNCVSVALVCMVKPARGVQNWTLGNMTLGSLGNETDFGDAGSEVDQRQYEFEWSASEQGLILSSIFFTSFIAPLLASFLKTWISGKNLLTGSTLLCGVLTILCPVASRISPYGLVIIRIVQGTMIGGFNVPVIGDSLAKWAPQSERLTMVAITYSGINVGGIVSSYFSGLLCGVPLDNGWPFVFYVFGALSLIYGAAWHFLSSSSPENHPFISEKEKEYILAHTQRSGAQGNDGKKGEKPPYWTILSSRPVIAFLLACALHIWSSNSLFTNLPMYYADALGFTVETTGLLVSITSFARLVGNYFWTSVSNQFISRTDFSVNKVRKGICITGFVIASVSQLSVTFVHETSRWAGFGLMMVVMFTQAVGSCILPTTPLDMAPKYAGLLSGMFVSFGNLVSISGPIVVSALTANDTVGEWSLVWYIMAAAFLGAGFIFVLFGEAKLQPWADESAGKPQGHVISPFVTMGRRFSAIAETPMFSPGVARKMTNFTKEISVPSPTTRKDLESGNRGGKDGKTEGGIWSIDRDDREKGEFRYRTNASEIKDISDFQKNAVAKPISDDLEEWEGNYGNDKMNGSTSHIELDTSSMNYADMETYRSEREKPSGQSEMNGSTSQNELDTSSLNYADMDTYLSEIEKPSVQSEMNGSTSQMELDTYSLDYDGIRSGAGIETRSSSRPDTQYVNDGYVSDSSVESDTSISDTSEIPENGKEASNDGFYTVKL